jgi:starch synthase
MEIFHISAECYPVAKWVAADVVGITKYQNKAGHLRVVIPCYDTKFKKKNNLNVSIGVL